jgi:MraZ protein
MDQNPTQLIEIEPPRGMFPARVDDRGRMKLPAVFKEYLDKFPEKRLWVTSLDRTIGQIYPISVWRDIEKFLDSYTEDPEAAERIAFNAADLGEEMEMDSQGRLVIPASLRKALGIEDQTVRLKVFRGYIEMLSERIYEERLASSSGTAKEDVVKLNRAGMGKKEKIQVPAPGGPQEAVQ